MSYFTRLLKKIISKYKNSQTLVNTWMKNPSWPTLVVVHHGTPNANGVLHFNKPFKVGTNIIVYQCKLDESVLSQLINQCGVHVCPSFSEGYGHYINEARSAQSYILTTDGEPMRSFINENGGQLIKPSKEIKKNYGSGYVVTETDIENAVQNILSLKVENIKYGGKQNRKMFLEDIQIFQNNITIAIKIFI